MNKKSNDIVSLSFARLPVFDSKKKLWGYELVYVSAQGDLTNSPENNDTIAVDLASSTYMAFQQILGRVKKIMINFSQKNILDNLPYALPASQAAVKIADPENLSYSALELTGQLKEDGYQIVAGWVPDHETCQALFRLADIICVNISDQNLSDLTSIYQTAKTYDASILANFVDDQAHFDICEQAGFSLFQGSFFKQTENVSVKKILSGTVSKFQLMKAIEQDDPDFDKLAKIIQADVAISFRLLSYLNSSTFGFRQKIGSIKDAISMLGWRNLKNWLRIVLLADVAEHQHASELIFLSAQRGKFLEQVVIDHDFWGFKPDSLLMLGMFSLLDALLNQPMAQIVKYLPLTDKLKGALCIEENNEYVPLLKLAQCLEEAKFEESENMINQLGLDPVKIQQAYYGAIEWANQLNEMQSSD
ncbi:MAG: HDOD domain-containing protein [Thermodesulfobacteriota bacterium]|nr:HDOD domain-containing protein [Thermodesulfobacteriota bacterium]